MFHANLITVIGAVLLCEACALSDVKVGKGPRARDASSDDLTIAEAADSGVKNMDAGGKVSATADAAPDDERDKPEKPAAAGGGGAGGSSGEGAAGSRADSDVDASAEPAAPRKWTAPSLIDFAKQPLRLQFGMDSAGRALALWVSSDNADARVYSRRYQGSTWSSPTIVLDENISELTGPLLATARSGRAFALLHRPMADAPAGATSLEMSLTVSSSQVYAVNMAEDATWSSSQRLQECLRDARALAVNDAGSAIAAGGRAVLSEQNPGWTVWWSRYEPSTGWENFTNLVTRQATTESTAEQRIDALDWPKALKVSVDKAGRGVVLWTRDRGVFVKAQDMGPIYLEEWPALAAGVTRPAPWIALGSDDYERSIAVWARYDGTRTDLLATRYIRGSGWDAPALVEHSDATVTSPSFAMDKQGNAMLVWAQSDGTTNAIFYNRYKLGSGWSGAQRVEPETSASNAQQPAIAMDDMGNVVAVWSDVGAIRASRYVVDMGWQAAEKISPDGQTAVAPQVVVSPSGVSMASWSEQGTGSPWFSRLE